MNHLHAIQYSRGGQLPFYLFDSLALSEEEAAIIMQNVNLKRAMAEALAEARALR